MKKLFVALVLVISVTYISALDIISVNTNNLTLNRTNFSGSAVLFNTVTSSNIIPKNIIFDNGIFSNRTDGINLNTNIHASDFIFSVSNTFWPDIGPLFLVSNIVNNAISEIPLTNYVSSIYSESNKVVSVWKGTYSEYLSLTNKTDSTTYMITDDVVYDTVGGYQEFLAYISIAPTTTVQLVQEKIIYDVSVSTNTVIDFDMSNLNFSNKVFTFEMWLNITTTNNYSLSWTANGKSLDTNQMYWVSGAPTFISIAKSYFAMRAFSTNSIHGNLMYIK